MPEIYIPQSKSAIQTPPHKAISTFDDNSTHFLSQLKRDRTEFERNVSLFRSDLALQTSGRKGEDWLLSAEYDFTHGIPTTNPGSQKMEADHHNIKTTAFSLNPGKAHAKNSFVSHLKWQSMKLRPARQHDRVPMLERCPQKWTTVCLKQLSAHRLAFAEKGDPGEGPGKGGKKRWRLLVGDKLGRNYNSIQSKGYKANSRDQSRDVVTIESCLPQFVVDQYQKAYSKLMQTRIANKKGGTVKAVINFTQGFINEWPYLYYSIQNKLVLVNPLEALYPELPTTQVQMVLSDILVSILETNISLYQLSPLYARKQKLVILFHPWFIELYTIQVNDLSAIQQWQQERQLESERRSEREQKNNKYNPLTRLNIKYRLECEKACDVHVDVNEMVICYHAGGQARQGDTQVMYQISLKQLFCQHADTDQPSMARWRLLNEQRPRATTSVLMFVRTPGTETVNNRQQQSGASHQLSRYANQNYRRVISVCSSAKIKLCHIFHDCMAKLQCTGVRTQEQAKQERLYSYVDTSYWGEGNSLEGWSLLVDKSRHCCLDSKWIIRRLGCQTAPGTDQNRCSRSSTMNTDQGHLYYYDYEVSQLGKTEIDEFDRFGDPIKVRIVEQIPHKCSLSTDSHATSIKLMIVFKNATWVIIQFDRPSDAIKVFNYGGYCLCQQPVESNQLEGGAVKCGCSSQLEILCYTDSTMLIRNKFTCRNYLIPADAVGSVQTFLPGEQHYLHTHKGLLGPHGKWSCSFSLTDCGYQITLQMRDIDRVVSTLYSYESNQSTESIYEALGLQLIATLSNRHPHDRLSEIIGGCLLTILCDVSGKYTVLTNRAKCISFHQLLRSGNKHGKVFKLAALLLQHMYRRGVTKDFIMAQSDYELKSECPSQSAESPNNISANTKNLLQASSPQSQQQQTQHSYLGISKSQCDKLLKQLLASTVMRYWHQKITDIDYVELIRKIERIFQITSDLKIDNLHLFDIRCVDEMGQGVMPGLNRDSDPRKPRKASSSDSQPNSPLGKNQPTSANQIANTEQHEGRSAQHLCLRDTTFDTSANTSCVDTGPSFSFMEYFRELVYFAGTLVECIPQGLAEDLVLKSLFGIEQGDGHREQDSQKFTPRWYHRYLFRHFMETYEPTLMEVWSTLFPTFLSEELVKCCQAYIQVSPINHRDRIIEILLASFAHEDGHIDDSIDRITHAIPTYFLDFLREHKKIDKDDINYSFDYLRRDIRLRSLNTKTSLGDPTHRLPAALVFQNILKAAMENHHKPNQNGAGEVGRSCRTDNI